MNYTWNKKWALDARWSTGATMWAQRYESGRRVQKFLSLLSLWSCASHTYSHCAVIWSQEGSVLCSTSTLFCTSYSVKRCSSICIPPVHSDTLGGLMLAYVLRQVQCSSFWHNAAPPFPQRGVELWSTTEPMFCPPASFGSGCFTGNGRKWPQSEGEKWRREPVGMRALRNWELG